MIKQLCSPFNVLSAFLGRGKVDVHEGHDHFHERTDWPNDVHDFIVEVRPSPRVRVDPSDTKDVCCQPAHALVARRQRDREAEFPAAAAERSLGGREATEEPGRVTIQ